MNEGVLEHNSLLACSREFAPHAMDPKKLSSDCRTAFAFGVGLYGFLLSRFAKDLRTMRNEVIVVVVVAELTPRSRTS